jgi:predicted P-loop ATPase
VAGNAGHTSTFNATAHVMVGFDLNESDTYAVIAEHFNPRCDPPWSERELRHKIASVAKQCQRERGYLLTAREAIKTSQQASAALQAPDAAAVDWDLDLLRKKDQSPKRTYTNTSIFVRLFPDYRGRWTLDEMTGQPWFDGAPMSETLVHEIRSHAEQRMGYTPSREDVEAAVMAAASERPFHPIRHYLRSIDWDGIERLRHIARNYLATDDELHAQMVRCWMIGAIARAMRPGCKLDTALMLVGAQGAGKSTFFNVLGGEWHADSFVDIMNKDSYSQIHAAWIYELSELENVVHGRAESRLKAWITSSCDMFRAPYKRVAEKRQRGVVLCGTTNRGQFLTDDTGSRRFWIVPVCQVIPRESLLAVRDQLWAEALCAYEAGEPWWFDHQLETMREAANQDYQEEDPWLEPVTLYSQGRTQVTSAEVLTYALKIETGRQTRADQMRISRVLVTAGWHRHQRMISGRKVWTYER